jgi:hypothetical protein
MSANASDPESATAVPVAKEAPTAQQISQPGVPKKITNAQTVCNEKNEKGKSCNGFLKQIRTGGEEAEKHLRGDDVLFKCQTCGTLYLGPPLGHVRDPKKQSRFVEKELSAILQAAGGTLPAFKMSERGTLVPVEEHSHHAPAPAAGAATPASPTAPAAATAAKKPAPAASPSRAASPQNSSPQADAHRPAAEAQAATGQASAAPMSPAAATASPAAGAETVSDLAPEASTELTPGAPPDSRAPAATNKSPDTLPETAPPDEKQ